MPAPVTEIYEIGKKYLFGVDETFHIGTITRIIGNEIELKDANVLIPADQIANLLAGGQIPKAVPMLPILIINRAIYRSAIPL